MKGEPLNQFFGYPWRVPATEGLVQGDTPVGDRCLWCEDVILYGDQGTWQMYFDGDASSIVPIHRECSFRSVAGSVGHLLEKCSCFGGDAEDPEGMTKRQAAMAAWQIAQALYAMEENL